VEPDFSETKANKSEYNDKTQDTCRSGATYTMGFKEGFTMTLNELGPNVKHLQNKRIKNKR
jgi:hypothetical protein